MLKLPKLLSYIPRFVGSPVWGLRLCLATSHAPFCVKSWLSGCVLPGRPHFTKQGLAPFRRQCWDKNESAFGLCLKTPSPEQHQAWVRHSLIDYLIKITVDGEHMNMWALWLPWKIKVLRTYQTPEWRKKQKPHWKSIKRMKPNIWDGDRPTDLSLGHLLCVARDWQAKHSQCLTHGPSLSSVSAADVTHLN